MKYKIYPVVFIIVLLGFMSVFGGIVDIDGIENSSDHTEVKFDKFEYSSNGNQAIVKQYVSLPCTYEEENHDDCDDKGETETYDFELAHYNDSVSVTVLQGGSIVQTVSSEIEYDNNSLTVIENTLNFVSPGDYILRYTIVCDAGVVSTHDESITITEGINGNFDLIGLNIICNETGNNFQFNSEHFNGRNGIDIENTYFDIFINLSAEIDTVSLPCLTNGYELQEYGNFTTDGNEITISYVDGSATVSQTFSYTYDGQYLTMMYAEPNEDRVTMFFKKATVLAKR